MVRVVITTSKREHDMQSNETFTIGNETFTREEYFASTGVWLDQPPKPTMLRIGDHYIRATEIVAIGAGFCGFEPAPGIVVYTKGEHRFSVHMDSLEEAKRAASELAESLEGAE